MSRLKLKMNKRNDTSLWVFGYGSICWHPGFTYGQSIIGSIRGFTRRFWQGNTTHRGIPGKPGRVATLVEESQVSTVFICLIIHNIHYYNKEHSIILILPLFLSNNVSIIIYKAFMVSKSARLL